MKKILLPSSFSGTVENVVNKDGLAKGIIDTTPEYKEFLSNIKAHDNAFDEKEFLKFSYHKQRRNKNKEQQLYQMLLLYDEVLFTDFDFEINYDYSELKKIGGLVYLNDDQISELAYTDRERKIDFNFSQYIKPAVIYNLKDRIKPFYEIKDEKFSDYRFASILFDLVYAEQEQKIQFSKVFLEFIKIAKINKDYYDSYANYKRKGITPVKGEFYSILLESVLGCVEPVLRDFNLANNQSVEIFNPEYSSEKLGLKTKKITDIVDTYGTLKIECTKVIQALPEFSSIQETLDFKEKNMTDIKRLRSVVDELLDIIENEGREKMIEQAAINVNKAARELNKGKELSKIDKWSIFLALPVSALEFLCTMPPIVSLPLSVFGISSYLTQKHIQKRNNWIRVVR